MSIDYLSGIPLYCLKGVTDYLKREDLGKFGCVSRFGRTYFQTRVAWVSHAQHLGLPRGQRTLEHVKAYFVNRLKQFASAEIEKYRNTPYPYPAEASRIIDRMSEVKDIKVVRKILTDHLYAKVLFCLAGQRHICFDRLNAPVSSGDNAYRYEYLDSFPTTLSQLAHLATKKGLLSDPTAMRIREMAFAPEQISEDSELVGANHRSVTYKSLDHFGHYFSLPEEFFDIDVNDLTLSAPLEELPDFTRDHPQIVNLNLRSSLLKTLPQSIGRLTGVRTLRLQMTGLEVIPSELLEMRSLKELRLPRRLERLANGSEVFQELKCRGVNITFGLEDADTGSETSSSDDETLSFE